ncbi:MAG TPA: Flp pilus assembly protein CpaB [Devosia sp.]|nr:Flp pilus assembly protein CpaB [Devosia sp.]
MRLVFALVLMIGLGLAGFAVYMAKGYIETYQAQLEKERASRVPEIPTVDIMVATRSLKYGEHLEKDDVRLTKFPKESLPDGTFASFDALFPKGEAVPRSVLRATEKNEAILAVKVTEPGRDAGLQLKSGMRAFAIKVNAESGVSGFLRPGDRVDIYWTGRLAGKDLRTEANSSGDVTKLIEAGVELIAVDQTSDGDTTDTIIARTVTVSVLPEQVAALAQAQSTGKLSLSLVGALDNTVAGQIEVDQNALLGIAPAPVVEETVVEKVCTIKNTRNGETVDTGIVIPCPPE